jgi:hypothetical protein
MVVRFEDVVHITRRIVAEDGAGAVTVHRLSDELTVNIDAIRVLAVDPSEFLRAAADRELEAIAETMRQPGPWIDRLVAGITETMFVSRHYMSANTQMATGLALGPGVVSWIDAVISLLEKSQRDDDWLFRAYRLVTSVTIGTAYTFRSHDGQQLDRSEVERATRRLLIGLAS